MMFKHVTLLFACMAAVSTTAGAARPKEDQSSAFEARQQGKLLSLREIEARIRPQMRGADYLGPDYDSRTGTYRLKFLRGEKMIWVDVDGRTGSIVGRSGD